MTIACGVDFGTSNSTVGWVRPGQPSLLTLEDGKTTLPSVVFFNADEDAVRYGRAALADYLEGYDGRLMRSLKSLLGTPLMEGQTEVGGRALPFRQLLGQFIGELKRRAEADAGRPFERAVLGRPVYFVDDDPVADRLAEDTLAAIARDVGFREIAFQYEPIAAAFDYESRIEREELVLIADIGGGTSDFSLLRLGPARAGRPDRRDDILATGGVHLGGTDFDKYLSLASVMPLLGYGSSLLSGAAVPSSYYFNLATWHTINLAYTRKSIAQLDDLARDAAEPAKLQRLRRLVEDRAGHWLAMRVEDAKIGLSSAPEVELDLDRLSPRERLQVARATFTEAIGGLVEGIGAAVPSSYYFNLATWHTINLAYTRKSIAQLDDLARDAAEPAKLQRLRRLVEDRAGHWLAMRVEDAKIGLSSAPEVELDLDRLSPRERLQVARATFTEAIGGLVEGIGAAVRRLLDEAGVDAGQVDTVFFTGGSSGVAALRERIAAIVPDARRVEGDLFGSIGAGLAIDAARKFG